MNIRIEQMEINNGTLTFATFAENVCDELREGLGLTEMNAWFWNLSNEAQEEILSRIHAAMIRRRHGTGGIVLPLPDLPNELAEICRRAGTEIEVLT